MNHSRAIAAVLCIMAFGIAQADDAIVAKYLANAGVLITHGDTKIVFDPLFDDNYDFYELVPKDIEQALFDGRPPFDGVDAIFVSHHHGDHTGGLETLRRELSKRNPAALSRIHVAPGIFVSRPLPDGGERNLMVELRERIEEMGATFIVHDRPAEIAPGVWVTGPVPRVHDERNYTAGPERLFVQEDGTSVPDTVPESQALVIVTRDGPILISGCGHAGIINTLEYANSSISAQPFQAAIGGFHLLAANSDVMSWTAERVAELGLQHLIGAHCTGIESVYTIRELAGLDRETARVGSTGTRYESGRGIIPGNINR